MQDQGSRTQDTEREEQAGRLVELLRAQPAVVRELARDWPPGSRVRAKEGVVLLVPAPGVVGSVVSYYEDGTIGILGPMAETKTSPITGVTIKQGEMIRAQCSPEELDYVGPCDDPEITRGDVEAALLLLRGQS